MKKLLLTLISAVVVTSSAASVVACGFREPANVILELSANIAKPNSPILRAYRKIVDSYNEERPDNPIQVEVRETPANNIDNEIATGQPLPSLYVAYGDVATKYETVLNQIDEGDKIIDMGQAINWDPEYIDKIDVGNEPALEYLKDYRDNGTVGNELTQNKPLDEITHLDENDPDYDRFHFHPLLDSFSREGSNNGKLYVAPTAKSGMNGVMNVRLLNELVKNVTSGEINLQSKFPDLRDDDYFFSQGGVDWSEVIDLPLKDLKGVDQLPESNIFRESESGITALFREWFSGVNNVLDLQAIMQDLSKLEVIVLAYTKLVDTATNRNFFVNHFSVAFDDVPGLIYTMQSSLGAGDKQIYSWNNQEPYNLNLYELDEHTKSIKDVIELFAWADRLRPLDNDAGNTPDHGYGGVTAKIGSGVYYSDTWQNAGMLAYFGSTAGAGYWINAKKPEGTQVGDLELMSAPSYQPAEGAPNPSFVGQQGPGMGMFKSKNQVKNEIAIDFLNYFLHAENNTEFAFAAGYIPANYYAYYTEKDLNGLPTENQMGPYYEVLNEEATKDNVEKPQIKAAKIVKKYVDSILKGEIELWTQTPTPFGDAMRYQVLSPWFEANFKTVQNHDLRFEKFWEDLNNQFSISSAWRVVHGIFPVEGSYTIISKEAEKLQRGR